MFAYLWGGGGGRKCSEKILTYWGPKICIWCILSIVLETLNVMVSLGSIY